MNKSQIQQLKNNWTDSMQCLACKAPVRMFDPHGPWQCYLIAMSPQNEDEIYCIISAGINISPELVEWKLSDIYLLYNSQGEGVQVDKEYRPKEARKILHELSKGIYEPRRN